MMFYHLITLRRDWMTTPFRKLLLARGDRLLSGTNPTLAVEGSAVARLPAILCVAQAAFLWIATSPTQVEAPPILAFGLAGQNARHKTARFLDAARAGLASTVKTSRPWMAIQPWSVPEARPSGIWPTRAAARGTASCLPAFFISPTR